MCSKSQSAPQGSRAILYAADMPDGPESPSEPGDTKSLAGNRTLSGRFVMGGSYPAVLSLAFAIFAVLMAAGVHVTLASYAAVLTGAALVTLHELKLPYRSEWRPSPDDVRTDVSFMLAIQVALPLLLSFLAVIAIANVLKDAGIAIDGLWPHDQPIAVQAALMLVLADLLRYWLHRAFHKFESMWRFHAVHHSPHRLYWVNVGRFHPIEKSVQYCADALPFVLVGVGGEALAAYFVFYAVNGFYQHSNCDVRLGPLNHLVSGPELHRWHHSMIPAESDNNFGNNLIVWDTLFGTRYLPSRRKVGPLGLINQDYPLGFMTQMRTPFVAGLDKAKAAEQNR